MSNGTRILKHILSKHKRDQTLTIDSCGCILSVIEQRGDLVLYATDLGDHPNRIDREVTITVLGTGQVFPDDFIGIFIGTVSMGTEVWHVYWY